MPNEPMTLSEMLRNPQRNNDGSWDELFNQKVMNAAADILELKLPCDVSLPPRTIIKKGCALETLLIGIQARL